jgi:chromosome segregation ATPase
MSKTWVAFPAIGLIVAGGLCLLVWQARTNSALTIRVDQLQRENVDVRARLDQAARKVTELSLLLDQSGSAETRQPAHDDRKVRDTQGLRAQDFHTIERLKAELAQATSSISQLENRILDLGSQVQTVSVENKRLAASEADLNENLAGANRIVEAMQRELKSKTDRLVQLEVFNKKLREQSTSDEKKLSGQVEVIRDLQELQRRRETYLNSMLRRYRDVTDQYRALAGVLEDRRQSDAPATSSIDLARIQNTISMAEEDLRLINSLTAQEARLQRQLLRP